MRVVHRLWLCAAADADRKAAAQPVRGEARDGVAALPSARPAALDSGQLACGARTAVNVH
jgi:hypothetical protein